MKSNNKFNILIIDDEKLNIELASIYLKEEKYNIFFALNAQNGFKLIDEKKIDLILLDINMPKTDGFSMCKILKDDPKTKDIPVVFLTAQTDIEYITKAFEVGGIDYITKPFNGVELKVRVKTHLQNVSYLEEIKHKQSKLAQLTVTDSLTKLHNSLYFDSKTKLFLLSKEPFWIMYIKIDKLEKLNEMYGFFETNKILKVFAKILQQKTFSNSIIARLYGASFAILTKNYEPQNIKDLYKQITAEVLKNKNLSGAISFKTVLYNVKNHELSLPQIYKNIDSTISKIDASSSDYIVI